MIKKHLIPNKYVIIIKSSKDEHLVSEVVELPGCHARAKSIGQLIKKTKESIRIHLRKGKKTDVSKFIGLYVIDL